MATRAIFQTGTKLFLVPCTPLKISRHLGMVVLLTTSVFVFRFYGGGGGGGDLNIMVHTLFRRSHS